MAKAEYQLSPNEFIIIKNDHVYHGNDSGEIILTNLSLVHITEKGAFKKTYITQKYPIDQIKVFNGKAQVLLGKNGNIDIYLINGQESFKFWNNETFFSEKKAEKDAINFIDAINQLFSGEVVNTNTSSKAMIPEIEIITDTLGDTVDAFKSALGFNTKKSSTIPIEKTTKKCNSCGATISGKKGQVVRCSYCDADQQL
jgi:hypothetical protein